MIPTPKIYLSNKELLREIHKSKLSFSWILDPKYTEYDLIVKDLEEIDINNVNELSAVMLAKQQRADRKSAERWEKEITNWQEGGSRGEKPKGAASRVPVESINTEDIVFRIMTYSQIPEEPGRKSKPKTNADIHTRLNFPPFKHYAFVNNELTEVVRSHWQGDLQTGKFNTEHGKITNNLARMYIKLCERYSTRSNWRGYCVDEDTEALTDKGWVNIDSINESNKILSYNGETLAWSKILSIYRGEYSGLMHKLDVRGYDTLITPNHKIVTERGLVPVELLKETDKMILLADGPNNVNEPVYSNSFVELAGWVMTEGCYEIERKVENKLGNIKRITVYQNQGKKADRIRNCLTDLGYKFSEGLRGKNICFSISRDDCKKIVSIFPEKNLNMDFILKLTLEQKHLLVETMIDGDGWRRKNGGRSYVQKDKHHVDLFQALCVLTGVRSNTHLAKSISYGKLSTCYSINLFSKAKNTTRVACVDFHGGKRNGRKHIGLGKITHPNEPTTFYQGKVWCPETEFGSFVARRNGTVYLTGNTYIDEMRSQALLQLTQIGLKFDESKSDNPFAYYTAVLTNSFTRIVNLEKKNQTIRDDLLIASGQSPSFSRQLEHEYAMVAEKDRAAALKENNP